MRIEKRDSSQERRILIGMIVDTAVLSRISVKWDGALFKASWSNLIASWCVKHLSKYGKAPGKAILTHFENWAAKSNDKDTSALVEKFLESLSNEYASLARDSNTEHLLDVAAEHFRRIQIAKLRDELEDDLETGDLEKAESRVFKFNRIEMGQGSGVDVLSDKNAIKQAFAERREPLVHYPGALKNFFGDALERDGFLAFMGPEKRGKTWWLMDLAWRAMTQHKKVAFFEVGDMSQNQIIRRFMIRASKRPLKRTEHPIKYPTLIEHVPGEQFATVEFEDREFAKDLSYKTAYAACAEILTKKLDSKEGLLKLSVHANSTISVNGMKASLEAWDRLGWTPDVIVVDYADILAPPVGVAESRDQINATWKGLRSLSQSLHCLVATATQSDAASYRTETIDRSNFSEDKRKLAHVTAMVGLNQTAGEKLNGVTRLNWVALREGEFSDSLCCHVAGCLAVGNPAIRSTF